MQNTKQILIFLIILSSFLQLIHPKNLETVKQKNQLFSDLFVENKCNLTRTQNKFAIVTVSHLRNPQGEFQYGVNFFKDYLKQYAEMDCDAFDSIYIIWNNEISPEEHNILQRKKFFKKQVYFLHTQSNNMDYRYIIPSWTNEQIFVSLDDDAVIDCQNLKKMFSQWKKSSIGNLGSFSTPQDRIIHYNYQKNQIKYQGGSKKIINIALPNVAILSRHYMDLYYSKIPQFQRIRQIVREYANCDDIALNFMVNQVYPQFNIMKIQGINYSIKKSKVQTNHKPDHWQKRNKCSNTFTQIFGHLSLQYTLKSDKYIHKDERIQIKKSNLCLTELKRNIIQTKYFTHKQYFIHIKKLYAFNSDKLQLVAKDNLFLTKKLEDKVKLIQSGQFDTSFIPKVSLNDLLPQNSQKKQTDQYQTHLTQKAQDSLKMIKNSQVDLIKQKDSIYMILTICLGLILLATLFIIYKQSQQIRIFAMTQLNKNKIYQFSESQKLVGQSSQTIDNQQ